MAEKPDPKTCMHESMSYKWGRTILLDTNMGILTIGPLTCNTCGATMKILGATESNVAKKRPFSHDNGLTICLPFVAEGEAVIEVEALATKQ